MGLPEPILAKYLKGPKAPKMAINFHVLCQSPEATSHLQKWLSPQDQGNPWPSSTDPSLWEPGVKHIYGIIYHYEPFSLRNSIVMVLGLHFSISNQVPKPITHLKARLQPLSLTIHGGYQKTIQGPQLPGLPGVGYLIPAVFPQGNTGPGFFKGNFKRLLIIQISCQGIKHSSTSWTTQFIHTGSIWTTCMALAHLGPFVFHCGNSRHKVHF
ncbi:hypothetical protein O181_130528 [Austropuccinia psidii MF-1]|uniref:Uncharacterized protein n=1 Tax=Austropuccinia psidii MF-1 TaxID=1389203 RepID=A0A9Q3L083_9BASI|nr:hypothetical protein [Austropuccinia psidii MF-1]